MIRPWYAVAALSVAIGCMARQSDYTGPELQLRAQPALLSAGDSLEVLLDNRSAEPIGYNLCASGLERRDGDSWQAVASDRACTMELRTLNQGEQARFAYTLPADITAGEYRAVTWVERLETGDRPGLTSESFRVRPPRT